MSSHGINLQGIFLIIKSSLHKWSFNMIQCILRVIPETTQGLQVWDSSLCWQENSCMKIGFPLVLTILENTLNCTPSCTFYGFKVKIQPTPPFTPIVRRCIVGLGNGWWHGNETNGGGQPTNSLKTKNFGSRYGNSDI